MVDATDSKSVSRKRVRVRVSPAAPNKKNQKSGSFCLSHGMRRELGDGSDDAWRSLARFCRNYVIISVEERSVVPRL